MASEKTAREAAERVIADNRKALHDYHVLETFEAGVVLLGTEVKSIREGSVNLRDSYARLENGEVWLLNMHVGPYSHSGYASHEERRQRKLLLHRSEIRKLTGKVAEKGLTLVPLRMYFKNGRAKLAIALARQSPEKALQSLETMKEKRNHAEGKLRANKEKCAKLEDKCSKLEEKERHLDEELRRSTAA